MEMRISLLALLLAVAMPSSVIKGQTPRFRASLDGARTQGSGHGGEYRDRDLTGGAHIASALEYALSPTRGAFVMLSADALELSSEHTSICIFGSNGECVHIYPRFTGISALAGGSVNPSEYIELRVATGFGAFRSAGTTAGSWVSQSDVAMFPFSRLGMTVGIRTVVIPSFRNDRLWMAPWMLGLRIR